MTTKGFFITALIYFGGAGLVGAASALALMRRSLLRFVEREHGQGSVLLSIRGYLGGWRPVSACLTAGLISAGLAIGMATLAWVLQWLLG